MYDRLIRSGIIDSDRIDRLSWSAEVFFRRLLSVVDDYGRYEARPLRLRAKLYSGKLSQVSESDIVKWMSSAAEAGLISFYEVEEKSYLEVLRFNQRLKTKKAKWPPPLPGSIPISYQQIFKTQPSAEEKRREEKGREDEGDAGAYARENPSTPSVFHDEHLSFFLTDKAMKENIEMLTRKKVTEDVLRYFNGQLFIKKKNHTSYSAWVEHLRNWLNTNPELNGNTTTSNANTLATDNREAFRNL